MAICNEIEEVHQQQPQVSHEGLKDGGMELVRLLVVRIQLPTIAVGCTVSVQNRLLWQPPSGTAVTRPPLFQLHASL
jgi:hypothetical protein